MREPDQTGSPNNFQFRFELKGSEENLFSVLKDDMGNLKW